MGLGIRASSNFRAERNDDLTAKVIFLSRKESQGMSFSHLKLGV